MDKHRPSLTGQDWVGRRRSSVMFQGLSPWDSSKKGKRRGSRITGSVSETGTESVSRNIPLIRMENTYRVKPGDCEHFEYKKVEGVILKVLETYLADKHYDPVQCPVHCKQLSTQIKHQVKEGGYNRHKLVCNVVLGQSSDQGFQLVSRALWDIESDDYACVQYRVNDLFVVGMVHAVYYE